MRILEIFVAAFLVGISTAALADNLTTFGTLTGRCTAVTAMDVSTAPTLCSNKLVNVEFPNGRVGFVFTLQRTGDVKPTVISFFGNGSEQLHVDADTAVQPVDSVNFTFRNSTDRLVAAGSCRFSNPYDGKPARVSCAADTNQGKFIGDFISNGVPPNMTQSR